MISTETNLFCMGACLRDCGFMSLLYKCASVFAKMCCIGVCRWCVRACECVCVVVVVYLCVLQVRNLAIFQSLSGVPFLA